MAKKNASIGDTILRVIAEAGGSISGSDLRDAMADIPDANRRYHAGILRKTGRITTTGGTSNTVYHLADGETPSPPAERIPHKAMSRKQTTPPARAAKTKGTPERDNVRTSPPAFDALVDHAHLSRTIAPHFLRRVLALALARPGDIPDADRQALAAVAAGC